jgi:hypothetical protein
VELRDENTPPPTTEPPITPQTVRSLRRNIETLKSSIELSPSSMSQLRRVFKGSLTQAEMNAQRGQDLTAYINAIKRQRTSSTRRRVQLGGAMTVQDASRRIENRKIEDMIKKARKARKQTEKNRDKSLSQTSMMGRVNQDSLEGRKDASELADEELFVIDSSGVV